MSPKELPAPATRNVTRVFRAATDAQVAEGIAWYADARGIAGDLASAHNLSVSTTAGIIAALSPLQSWGANVNLAGRLIRSGGLTSGYLGNGLRKANAILAGTDPLEVLTSNKVRAFYLGIVSEGQTDAVCIDRHAFCVSINRRLTDTPHLSNARYRASADAYVRAARRLSREFGPISPAQVQAATWVAWRRRFWSEGAFDSHD